MRDAQVVRDRKKVGNPCCRAAGHKTAYIIIVTFSPVPGAELFSVFVPCHFRFWNAFCYEAYLHSFSASYSDVFP